MKTMKVSSDTFTKKVLTAKERKLMETIENQANPIRDQVNALLTIAIMPETSQRVAREKRREVEPLQKKLGHLARLKAGIGAKRSRDRYFPAFKSQDDQSFLGFVENDLR